MPHYRPAPDIIPGEHLPAYTARERIYLIRDFAVKLDDVHFGTDRTELAEQLGYLGGKLLHFLTESFSDDDLRELDELLYGYVDEMLSIVDAAARRLRERVQERVGEVSS